MAAGASPSIASRSTWRASDLPSPMITGGIRCNAQDRIAQGVAGCPQGASRAGEGVHPPARSAQRRAAHAALDQGREELRVRWAGRQADAARAVRRPQPADRLPLHVRSGLGAGLPELLVPRRPHRRRARASRAARRHAAGGLARAAARDRGLQEAHGLALQVAVVLRQRLQRRLSTCRSARTSWPRARSTTTTA